MDGIAVAPAVEDAVVYEAEALTATTSDVAALAYRLWQERGCPVGSPDEDWHKAEELLVAAVPMVDK